MKALDKSVETLGLWIVTSSVTFIKSVNQSSIKPCLKDILMDHCIKKQITYLQYGFISNMGLSDALNMWSGVGVKVETPFQTH